MRLASDARDRRAAQMLVKQVRRDKSDVRDLFALASLPTRNADPTGCFDNAKFPEKGISRHYRRKRPIVRICDRARRSSLIPVKQVGKQGLRVREPALHGGYSAAF